MIIFNIGKRKKIDRASFLNALDTNISELTAVLMRYAVIFCLHNGNFKITIVLHFFALFDASNNLIVGNSLNDKLRYL